MPTTFKPVPPFYDDDSAASHAGFASTHRPATLLVLLIPAGLDDTPNTECEDPLHSHRSTLAPESRNATKSHHYRPSPYSKKAVSRPNPASSSGNEGSSEVSSDEECIASSLSGESKIPKPQGEPGRPGRGGYNLQAALDWKPKAYSMFRKFTHGLVDKYLDTSKCISTQNREMLKLVCNKATAAFPDLDNYDKAWPVIDVAMLHLKYTSSRARYREIKIAAGKAK